MSQMLNSAGGQPQGAGYHGVTQGHVSVTANPSAINSMTTNPRTSSLGLSSPQHYGQLSSAQQHHHHQQHMLQQQQHHHLQHMQQQPQQQQQSLQQQQTYQPAPKMTSSSVQFQPQPQGAVGGTGTPILGSGAGTYRGLLRRNPAPASTAGVVSVPRGLVDGSGDGAKGDAVGLEADRVGVASKSAEGSVKPKATPTAKDKDEKETMNLANTKEKTPMCLINELARFNKISHQYTLVDEQGPAHKKTFYVKLKLGEEEYSAEGESIKKAQHAAAAIARKETKFSHPAPKPPRHLEAVEGNITPTVELNAMAMKRGEPALYKLIEPRNQNYSQPNIDFRGMYNQRYHYGRPPRPFYVMLRVGTKEFIGDGPTRQAARHNAATKALRVLKNLPVPADAAKTPTEEEEEEESEDGIKSEISLVHELALKRNLPVAFEVVRESGPPHMKNFVTKCVVGEMTTEAEGNSKKLSKKRAAELMLEELKKLPAVPVVMKAKLKPPTNKKKNRNIIKVQKADPNYGVGVNPISRLIQIMQAQKKKEPIYTLMAEKGLPRRREFVIQCQVEDSISEGAGPNKKLAKRNAAESMLQLLGFNRPSPQPTKPAIKNSQSCEGGSSSDKKVTFVDPASSGEREKGAEKSSGGAGCQVPGLLRLNHATHIPGLTFPSPANPFAGGNEAVSAVLSKAGKQPEKQAVALAEFLNIPIKFEEFTKSNSGSEYLTRVTLSTQPPQVYHGTGPTREMSRDAAALSTVQNLLMMATGAAGDAGSLKAEGGVKGGLPRQLNSGGDHM